MTAGPWRPVWLEMYDARVEDIWVRYSLAPGLRECSGRIFASVVGVPEGAAASGGSGVRGRSADGRRVEGESDEDVRPEAGIGGWGRRSVSWMGGGGGPV